MVCQKQHYSSNTQNQASQPLEYVTQQNPPYQNANLLTSKKKWNYCTKQSAFIFFMSNTQNNTNWLLWAGLHQRLGCRAVVRDRRLRNGCSYPLAVGRAKRQLALGDNVSLVYADEETWLGLRRCHGRSRASSADLKRMQSKKPNRIRHKIKLRNL
jgi:hypothetical protein